MIAGVIGNRPADLMQPNGCKSRRGKSSSHEAEEARRFERSGVKSPDKPDERTGNDSIGRRYRTLCKPRDRKLLKPNLSITGEGSIRRRKRADARRGFKRGNGDGTSTRVVSGLERPCGSRGEILRSKVGAGDGAEGPRASAGSIRAMNHR